LISNCKFFLHSVTARNSSNLFAPIIEGGDACITRCRNASQAPHLHHASPAHPSAVVAGSPRPGILCADAGPNSRSKGRPKISPREAPSDPRLNRPGAPTVSEADAITALARARWVAQARDHMDVVERSRIKPEHAPCAEPGSETWSTLFRLSDAAEWITGCTLDVAGGRSDALRVGSPRRKTHQMKRPAAGRRPVVRTRVRILVLTLTQQRQPAATTHRQLSNKDALR
jgi:hypothetical protein